MSTLTEVILAHIEERLGSVFTNIPATITSVSNLADNKVSVQVAIDHITDSGVAIPFTILEDVPIHWPAGGGGILTFPLKEGDDVWLSVSMRSVTEFRLSTSGTVQPDDERRHDLSDSYVIPCIFRDDNAPTIDTNDVVLSFSNAEIRMNDVGDITITSNNETTVNSPIAIVNATTTINGDTIINGNLSVDGTIGSTGDITTDTNVTATLTVTGLVDVIAGTSPASVHLLTHTHYDTTQTMVFTGTPFLV